LPGPQRRRRRRRGALPVRDEARRLTEPSLRVSADASGSPPTPGAARASRADGSLRSRPRRRTGCALMARCARGLAGGPAAASPRSPRAPTHLQAAADPPAPTTEALSHRVAKWPLSHQTRYSGGMAAAFRTAAFLVAAGSFLAAPSLRAQGIASNADEPREGEEVKGSSHVAEINEIERGFYLSVDYGPNYFIPLKGTGFVALNTDGKAPGTRM